MTNIQKLFATLLIYIITVNILFLLFGSIENVSTIYSNSKILYLVIDTVKFVPIVFIWLKKPFNLLHVFGLAFLDSILYQIFIALFYNLMT